jgi:hypothetical protein
METNLRTAMEELEKYECCGVPAHVWVQDDMVCLAPSGASTHRNTVVGEVAMLGAEAIPSPLLGEFQPE